MIEIIIDKEEEKKTIGVIENGKLIEVYEENKENKHERNEGNIYSRYASSFYWYRNRKK